MIGENIQVPGWYVALGCGVLFIAMCLNDSVTEDKCHKKGGLMIQGACVKVEMVK
jgi:hypothetical protein